MRGQPSLGPEIAIWEIILRFLRDGIDLTHLHLEDVFKASRTPVNTESVILIPLAYNS